MTDRSQPTAETGAERRSLLVVTTVSGTMRFLVPYVRHFRQHGWRVDGSARGITDDPRASGVFDAVHELPLSRSVTDIGGLAAGVTTLAATLRNGYDIVHVHTPIAAFITRAVVSRMASESRPRVVYTAHGFHFHSAGSWLTNAIFLTAERVAGRWTDRLVVINRDDYEAARRHRIVSDRRLCYMRGIGLDTEWWSPASVTPDAARSALESIGMAADRPYFVTVGELGRNKRPTDVVAALAQMQDREPAMLFLGDGPERSRVEELASELGVADRVVVTWTDDVRPFVASALALVQASKREGLPRSIMEALALEVPVITSAARGSRDLVGSDRGLIVPIGDTAAMAAAMDRLAGSPAERLEMGRRGRRTMVERYDLQPLLEEHERLYDGLLADHA